MIIVSSMFTEYNIYMNKSSFLTGLLNTEKKNIAEYLATWDDLNVFFKTLDNAWDFVAQIWKSDIETNAENEMAFRKKVNNYLNTRSKYGLHVSLYGRFTDIFDIEHGKISSQKELDDYCIELEKKATLFQRELSREEDKMKDFNGDSFVDLRKYFLEIMVDQFKEMDNEKQKKILEEMVKKLNSLSPEELNEFKNKMNISDITDESVKKILLGGGIYSMFAGAVGIIGFPAYIFLTSFIGGISSIIGITLPFGVYTGATSIMAFLSSWFLPIVIAGGWFFSDKYTTKLRKIFTVASMVSISFQSYKDTSLESVNEFIEAHTIKSDIENVDF
tara:strand:- start:7 stop:1002 length:996 start_codon:yes stop_codon:yes gene_type:complete